MGDPHFISLDGLGFTFNGLGEFILLESELLELQGRMELAIDHNQAQKATVLLAIVARQKTPESDVIEIRFSTDRSEIGSQHLFWGKYLISMIDIFHKHDHLLSKLYISVQWCMVVFRF